MSIIEKLAAAAGADLDLLAVRRAQDDRACETRMVDFAFVTELEASARAIAGFLVDFGYAGTRACPEDAGYRVLASIEMPLDQQVLLSVSGFMLCIAELFSARYDGWGAIIVREA